MKRIISYISLFLFLSACAETQGVADALARQSAKTAVNTALSSRFPNVPAGLVTPFTDCVIENASAAEIISLSTAAVAGLEDEVVRLTGEVLSRAPTQTCVARASVDALTNP